MGQQHLRIKRFCATLTGVAIDTAGPPVDATPIDYRDFAGGRILAATTIASTTITFWESDEPGGTYRKCMSGGSAVTATLTGGAAESCEIPAACAPCKWLKLQSNADDAETVTVILKS